MNGKRQRRKPQGSRTSSRESPPAKRVRFSGSMHQGAPGVSGKDSESSRGKALNPRKKAVAPPAAMQKDALNAATSALEVNRDDGDPVTRHKSPGSPTLLRGVQEIASTDRQDVSISANLDKGRTSSEQSAFDNAFEDNDTANQSQPSAPPSTELLISSEVPNVSASKEQQTHPLAPEAESNVISNAGHASGTVYEAVESSSPHSSSPPRKGLSTLQSTILEPRSIEVQFLRWRNARITNNQPDVLRDGTTFKREYRKAFIASKLAALQEFKKAGRIMATGFTSIEMEHFMDMVTFDDEQISGKVRATNVIDKHDPVLSGNEARIVTKIEWRLIEIAISCTILDCDENVLSKQEIGEVIGNRFKTGLGKSHERAILEECLEMSKRIADEMTSYHEQYGSDEGFLPMGVAGETRVCDLVGNPDALRSRMTNCQPLDVIDGLSTKKWIDMRIRDLDIGENHSAPVEEYCPELTTNSFLTMMGAMDNGESGDVNSGTAVNYNSIGQVNSGQGDQVSALRLPVERSDESTDCVDEGSDYEEESAGEDGNLCHNQ